MFTVYTNYPSGDFEKETAETMEEAKEIKDWYISKGINPDNISIEEECYNREEISR